MLRGLIVNVFVICCAVIPGSVLAQDTLRHITVTGQGQVDAAPDIATISLGVAHEDRVARAAMDRVSADVQALFQRLSGLGVQPRDVQTTSLRLDPIWRDRSQSREVPVIEGFMASNDLSIRLRDMATLGDVLEALLDSGANRFNGVSFSVSDPVPLLDEARKLAVADARRKAELYASAAGVTLGDVEEIFEPGSGVSPSPRFARAEAMVSSGMPVAGGELTFDAQITIVYSLTQ